MKNEPVLSDVTLNCRDCHQSFTWPVREQLFYKEHNYVRPKRCRRCRKTRMQYFRIQADLRELSINDSQSATKVVKR